MNNSIDFYLAQIQKAKFVPVSNSIWGNIKDEGLDEEQNAKSRNSWLMTQLDMLDNDKTNLQNFDDDTINKFNSFDIELKQIYNGKIVDLIDYDSGAITLVKTK